MSRCGSPVQRVHGLDEPVGIRQKRSAHRDQVDRRVADQLIRVREIPDAAHADDRGVSDAFQRLGVRHEVAWRALKRCGTAPAHPAGHVEEVDTRLFEGDGEPGRILELHPRGVQVHDADPVQEQGIVDPASDAVDGLERESSPVLQRTAVAVGPSIREERVELVKEEAVRAVEFDGIEPRG